MSLRAVADFGYSFSAGFEAWGFLPTCSRCEGHGARHGLACAGSLCGGSFADRDRRRDTGDDGRHLSFLAYADTILGRIGPRGIDPATRIVGFVATMGMGLIFRGVTEAIRNYVLGGAHRRGQV
jgi:hypothetical protein